MMNLKQRLFDTRYREGNRIFEKASPGLQERVSQYLGQRLVYLDETVTGTIVHNMMEDLTNRSASCMKQLGDYVVKSQMTPIYFCWIKEAVQQKGAVGRRQNGVAKLHESAAKRYQTLVIAQDESHYATLCKTKSNHEPRYVVFVTVKKKNRRK